MFIRVDMPSNERVEGFSFINLDGDEETVSIPDANYALDTHSTVDIESSGDGNVTFYKADIPKLIKALQMAYDYKGE